MPAPDWWIGALRLGRAGSGFVLYKKTLCGMLQEDAVRRVPSQARSACISSSHTECGIGYALQSTLQPRVIAKSRAASPNLIGNTSSYMPCAAKIGVLRFDGPKWLSIKLGEALSG